MQLTMLIAFRCLVHRCSSQDNHHPSSNHQRKWKILRWWKLWHKHEFGMREWSFLLQVRRRKPCDDFSLLSLVRFTKLRKKCCAKLNTWIWTNTLHGIWWTDAWAPQPNVRFIPHHQYTSPKNGRRGVVTCLWSSPKWTQDLTHQRSRVSREQHVPDSSAFAVPDQASCSTPSTLREIFGRQTDTDADTDTDTDAKRRQQDKITNNKQRLNLTHVTHILGSVVLVSRWFEGDQACCQKRPGYVPKLYMTFEKVRREVSFETLIPPWLARSAKWPQKRSCLGRRGDGVCLGGGRKEWWWWEGRGVECVGGWCEVEGGGEESETSRVCLADAAGQAECRLKSEFLPKPSQKSTRQQKLWNGKRRTIEEKQKWNNNLSKNKPLTSSLSLLLLCLRCSIQF